MLLVVAGSAMADVGPHGRQAVEPALDIALEETAAVGCAPAAGAP